MDLLDSKERHSEQGGRPTFGLRLSMNSVVEGSFHVSGTSDFEGRDTSTHR